MGLCDFGRIYLFSAISGVITLDGVPVINAWLVRKAARGKEFTDRAFTNDKGHFEFPALYERTLMKYVPQEFSASQKIVVYVNSQKYEMWNGIKCSKEENAESRGKPLIVTCELNSGVRRIEIRGGWYTTHCVWDVEPDIRIEWTKENSFEPGTEDDDLYVMDESSPVKK